MSVVKLFSRRQKELRGEIIDIFTYDVLPTEFRVQVAYILKDTIGIDKTGHKQPNTIYNHISDTLCREYGILELFPGTGTYEKEVSTFLLSTPETEKVLDLIELCFRYISLVVNKDHASYRYYNDVKLYPDAAVEELNIRFKEHGLGYSFDGNEIIRIDSMYTHTEITKCVINLLAGKSFHGANEEYLKAHEHYRHGRNKECLNECLKAFESTLKIICTEKGWHFNQTDTASKLIKVCFDNELVPSFTQNQFSSLQNLLVSGIPTIRNKQGGHGQGQVPQKVDDEMTRYALNLTGSNIIFLVEQSGIR